MERPKREGIMLANPATERRVLSLGDKFFAQPKYNGERMRVEWFHGEPVLLSSYGNEFKFLGHIKEMIREQYGHIQLPLDGEAYVHGWPRERIHSAVSRKVNENPDAAKLEFHIFDHQGPGSQWQRIHELYGKQLPWPLQLVPYTIETPDTWMNKAREWTDLGYEGIILRGAIWDYEKKRTSFLLKFKPTELDEYIIVGVNEAISKDGYEKGMVGSFSVKGDDETVFDVGAGKMDHPTRTKLWQNRGDILGKPLLVKHEKIRTVRGIPICAVAVEVKL